MWVWGISPHIQTRICATKEPTMLILIDNYDSFTYNLAHLLGDLGLPTRVLRNDAATPDEILALNPQAIVFSPGPKDPNHAGICLDLTRAAADRRIPLFGVCLGCQIIAQAFGGHIIRAPTPVHGKTDRIRHDGSPLFAGIKNDFTATRYHSLIVDADRLPASLAPTAHGKDDILMAFQHRDLPLYGVQFHPESIASEHGHRLLANFAALSGIPLPDQADQEQNP